MQLTAQTDWTLAARKFGRAFRFQYVITQAKLDIPQFQTFARMSWTLHTGPDLPVCELFDRDEAFLGYLIGIAVGPDGLIDKASNRLPVSQNDPGFWDAFEAWLVDAAGRYAFVIEVAGETRLYCDPVGMIGAVYNAADRLVAASPKLAIFDDLRPNPKFDLDVIRNHAGKFSLFHTVDERVRRLNPNNYLKLNDFSEHRHWPRGEHFRVSGDKMLGLFDEIYDRAAFNIAEISRAYPVSLPVSGGHDSRLLLAFAKDHAAQINQFYSHVNNYSTRRDAAIGGELCKAIGVPHEVHDWRESSTEKWEVNEARAFWQATFGIDSPLPAEYENGVIKQVPRDNVIMRGHQTDLLRAVYVFKSKAYWKDADWQIKRLLIVPGKLFNREVFDRFEAEFYAWQDTLPGNAMEKAADFMFLEIYYNSTVGATFPALWHNFYLSPFNSRRLIGLSLSFTEDARRAGRPVFDIIERRTPELSAIPFDFELNPDLAFIGDLDHYREATGKRVSASRKRLSRYKSAAS